MATYAAKLKQTLGDKAARLEQDGSIVISNNIDSGVTAAVPQTPNAASTRAAANGAIPLTGAVCSITTGAASAYTLANGTPGQILVMVVVTDGGEGTVTPVTATGWATAVFTDDIDTLSVMYVNDTIGWVVLGNAGDGTNLVALTQ